MNLTPEQDNAVRTQCRKCTEEIKAAMNKKPKPSWNETATPIIDKYHKIVEPLGISKIAFTVMTGRLNGRFGV